MSEIPSGLGGDVGLYSNYVGRGLTFSKDRPVLQGRLEYQMPAGFYGGFVVTNRADILNEETAEVDVYTGYRAHLREWAVDIGTVAWLFPGGRFERSDKSYNMLEPVVDITYKVVGISYWYDLEDYLGLNSDTATVNYGVAPNGPSRGSSYVELHLTLPLSRTLSFSLHAGRQFMRNYAALSYSEWGAAIEQGVGRGFTLGAAYTDTNADRRLYTGPNGLLLGRGRGFLYLKRDFP